MKTMSSEWTEGFPEEPGQYWFYGWRSTMDKRDNDRRLLFVRVAKTANSLLCVAEGHFMFVAEGAEGVWQKIEEPTLPETEMHWHRGLKVNRKGSTGKYEIYSVDYENSTAEIQKQGDYLRTRVPLSELKLSP